MSRRTRGGSRGKRKGAGTLSDEQAGMASGDLDGTAEDGGEHHLPGGRRGRRRRRRGSGRGSGHVEREQEGGACPEGRRGGRGNGPSLRRPGRGRGKSNFVPLQEWKPVSLGPSDVRNLVRLSMDEVVDEVSKNIKAFVYTVNKISQRESEVMSNVLEIISKLATSLGVHAYNMEGTAGQEASLVLAEVLSDRCAHFHMQLRCYIEAIPEPLKMLQLCDMFRILLESLPECSWSCLPVEQLNGAIERCEFGSGSAELKVILQQRMHEVMELKNDITERRLEKNKIIAVQGNCEIVWNNSEYRTLPLLPSWDEVCVNKAPVKLRPNIVDGAYEDWMHYYDVQFRLLREDFIAPLRRGICDFLDGMSGRKLRDVKVYNSVKIVKPEFTFSGIGYKVHFETLHLQRCKWEHSKRLMFGSLVCLSPDNFKNVVLFATVSDRKPEDLKRGLVSLQFEVGANLQYIFDSKSVFVMVESLAFFEASRHIMRSLQTAEVETMPFTRYIIKGDCTSVNAPKYLDVTNNCYNLSCLYGSKESSKQPLVFNILDCKKWQVAKSVELDQSQLDAIQQALTQEIAVIQGPPGTGKTYIGLKIVETLLRNRKVWDPDRQSPILVMCYTNHALDQFLQGILNIRLPEDDDDDDELSKLLRKASIEPQKSGVPKIVRVGGRSQNEVVNEFNVEKLVRTVFIPRNIRQTFNSCKDRIKGFSHATDVKEIEKFFDPKYHTFLKLYELSGLVDDPDHMYQLSQLARTEEERGYELEIWLGLWDQVEITATEDGKIISEVVIDSTYPMTGEEGIKDIHLDEMNSNGNDAAANIDHDMVPNTAAIYIKSNDDQGKQVGDTKDVIENNPGDEVIDVQGEAEMEESSRMLTEDMEDFQPIDFGEVKEHADTLPNIPLTNSELLPCVNGTILNDDGIDTNIEVDDRDIYDDTNEQNEDSEVQYDQLIVVQKPAEEIKKVIMWQPKPGADKSVQKYLFKTTMSPLQAKAVGDVSALKVQQRWQLYNYWVEKKYQNMVNMNQNSFDQYTKLCEEYKVTKQKSHHCVFETSDVIGLTTTGAAKHQHIIHMVKPKIVIVEEAAEVLESHIVSALSAGTQHLILIGDHKQLRPKPNEYELVRKYNLDISLFERLVHHQLPHATLNIQHRMRPEIAQLVHPHIYETLYNHDSVLQYDNVKGVFRNMFFINHEYPEETEENLMSHANDHEAKFIVALCKYLLQQGYDKSQITILTPYTGQLLKLKSLLPKATFFGIRVTAVDNFQGEENDIILLSLVRSNDVGQLGFLKEPNRVCVALSRAKKGFYCIGNFRMLRANAPIWEQIMFDMESKGYVGDGVQLQCQIHTKSTFIARLPNDFNKYAAEGGCTLPCEFRLQCGHTCTKKCHLQDQKHEKFKCKQPCAKRCYSGHNCKQLCFNECPPCAEKVLKILSKCGHSQEMLCHEDPDDFQCTSPCTKQCISGHQCTRICSQPCGKCNVHIEKIMPVCNHVQKLPCHQEVTSYLCKASCPKMCERGHPCKKMCHEVCGCDVPVMKEIPLCKHIVAMPCCIDPNNFACNVILKVLCASKMHILEQSCGGPKQPCKVLVEKSIPNCGHTQSMPCYQHPITFSCLAFCEKWLNCYRHKCPKLCGEPCMSKCEAMVEKTQLCGHVIYVVCHLSQFAAIQCTQKCTKTLPCGHPCSETCNSPCTTQCRKQITSHLPCGHTLKQECYKMKAPNLYQCEKKLDIMLHCGHPATVKCCDSQYGVKCKKTVLHEYPCKHTAKVPCHQSYDPASTCKNRCEAILLCGHQCSGTCGKCYARHMHQTCPYDIKLSRHCGHTVSTPCKGLSDSCTLKYTFCCPHEKVDLRCPDPFPLCSKPCLWTCPHYRCENMCHELCNRPRCDKRCDKLLICGHQCFGVCGEPCLTVCLECNEKEFKQHIRGLNPGKKGKIPKGLLYIQQKLCGHIYTVEFMDKYVDSNKSTLVRPIQCPENSCCGQIEIGFRYGNAQRIFLQEVRQVSSDEKDMAQKSTDAILNEIRSSTPNPMNYNKDILKLCRNFAENFVHHQGKDEAQMVHLLLQASKIIEFGERSGIGANMLQFAETCSNFVNLSSTNNSLMYQLSQQLIEDFASEIFRFMLQTHCIVAKKYCLAFPEAVVIKMDKKYIAPVEKILDMFENNHNKRFSEVTFKQLSKLLQMVCPMNVVVTYSRVFLTRCHWLKCIRHGFYSAAPKANIKCPKCDMK